MEEYLNVFKALACKMRIRILRILQQAGKGLCVCEIMDALEENQYNVSRHLKVLKYAGLVKDEKKGKWIEYRLVEPKNSFYEKLYEAIYQIQEKEYRDDFKRLEARLALRKNDVCVIGIAER